MCHRPPYMKIELNVQKPFPYYFHRWTSTYKRWERAEDGFISICSACRQEQSCSFLLPCHSPTGLSTTLTALIWRSWILDRATPTPCPRSSSPSSCSRHTGRSTRGCEMTSPSSWSSWKRTRWTRILLLNALLSVSVCNWFADCHLFLHPHRWKYCITSSSCSTML